MDLKSLKKNIDQQTRNGRQEIYISTNTLKELGLDLNITENKEVFVNIYRLNQLIERYEYEQKLEKQANQMNNDIER